MKITLTAPETEYRATIDTEVTRVDIREAFIGAMFISPDGETLVVFHRDSGYEVSYQAADYRPVRELELKGDRITVDGTECDQHLAARHAEPPRAEEEAWAALPERPSRRRRCTCDWNDEGDLVLWDAGCEVHEEDPT